jgi:hypothetical protein
MVSFFLMSQSVGYDRASETLLTTSFTMDKIASDDDPVNAKQT